MAIGDAPYVEPPYIEPLGARELGLHVPETVHGVMIAPAGLVLVKRRLSFFHIVAILERLITGYGRALADKGPHVLYWVKSGRRSPAIKVKAIVLACGMVALACCITLADLFLTGGNTLA